MVTKLSCFLLLAAVIMEASATSVLRVNQTNHASMSETYKDPRSDFQCGQTLSSTSGNFVNPSYPSPDGGPLHCPLDVHLASENICQLRYDFTTFELGQPNSQGICFYDFMNIRGTTNDAIVPKLCGLNTGQHMYVDVDPTTTTSIKTTIDLAGLVDSRRWKIHITQIPCDSTEKAPAGCRQYFTSLSAIVHSFNYKQPDFDTFVVGTLQPNLHLANLDYKICIKPEPNYCSITWSVFPPNNRYSFVMTEDAPADALVIGDTTVIMDPFDPNGPCHDYVLIPGGKLADRHCGLAFPETVTSSAQPFSMHVKTDDLELVDNYNTGFSLLYAEHSC